VLVPCECFAHEKYSFFCCGNNDCGVIKEIKYLKDGSKYISIETLDGEFRGAVFPKNHTITPSPDGKNHACILQDGSPRCLFLSGEV